MRKTELKKNKKALIVSKVIMRWENFEPEKTYHFSLLRSPVRSGIFLES